MYVMGFNLLDFMFADSTEPPLVKAYVRIFYLYIFHIIYVVRHIGIPGTDI